MSDSDLRPDGLPSRRTMRRDRRAHKARRRRQIQALAAGGLVLGVGATVTLAAWTDQEFGIGQFDAGTFQIEANIDGTWQSENAMQFEATNMFPSDRAYAPVLIRTSVDTTFDGALMVSGSKGSGDLAPHLRYRAVASTGLSPEAAESFSCGPENFTSDANGYIYGGPDTFVTMNTAHTADDEAPVSAGEQDVAAYCFEVELDPDTPNEAQSWTAEHEWTWEAESIVPD